MSGNILGGAAVGLLAINVVIEPPAVIEYKPVNVDDVKRQWYKQQIQRQQPDAPPPVQKRPRLK